ncbi:ferredoxin [Mycobacterium colombiense]|uniref:ferredoxin n=1 Tax=Mycobacterium colombiense TaxID=339268 RepID=UPI00200A5471|nr:ferredoxin [Mycobacterium colombiense]MCK8647111.1 ferredoxin [Mycobacterium colombiense]
MKIDVDRDRCEGHGMCEVIAPKLFSVDDEGHLTVLTDDVAPSDEAQVRDAMLACPVAALRLSEIANEGE